MVQTVNPYTIVEEFERCVAEYAGSKYAVAVSSCSCALFLCCKYLKVQEVTIPARTYVSVPCEIINAGGRVKFEHTDWKGSYQLKPYPIWDSAIHFCRGMYMKGTYCCLSFHIKKAIPIGRGGMILTDSLESSRWLKRARYSGRNPIPLMEDVFDMIGHDMYMTPEEAARGLMFMQIAQDNYPDKTDEYPDLSQFEIFTKELHER